jgi:hypothetical protein
MSPSVTYPWKRTLIALVLFGAAFGYVEASVVCYLRLLHEPVRQKIHPGIPPGDLFPLTTLDQLRASPDQLRTLSTEVGREAATIAMLAAVALAVASDTAQWAAAFAVAFGVWDLAFYGFLKVLLDWPASLFTWDILFLIPVPWAAPVLAPALVAATMVGAGAWQLRHPTRIGALQWTGISAGAVVILVSFMMDYRRLMAGAMPAAFAWGVFAAGLLLGTGSYVWAAYPRERMERATERYSRQTTAAKAQ